MIVLGCVLVLACWCLLSLAMPRHHRTVSARPPAPATVRALRSGGWLALAASFVCFVRAIGWEQGPVFWASALVLGAIAWALILAGLPERRPGR